MIAFVSEQVKAAPAAASSYSISLPGTNPGSTIFLCLAIAPDASTPGISSITDDVGGSWLTPENVVPSATSAGYGLCTSLARTPPATLTLTMTGLASVCYKVLEFSNCQRLVDAGSANNAGTSTSASTNNATPTLAGTLGLALFAVPVAQGSFTPGGSYLQAGTPNNSAIDLCAEYLLSSPSGSQSASGTLASAPTNSWRSVVAFFKAGPVGPVEVVPTLQQAVPRAAFF